MNGDKADCSVCPGRCFSDSLPLSDCKLAPKAMNRFEWIFLGNVDNEPRNR